MFIDPCLKLNYEWLDATDRSISLPVKFQGKEKDSVKFKNSGAWYRFNGTGATMMATKCIDQLDRCGGRYPAYLHDDFPGTYIIIYKPIENL